MVNGVFGFGPCRVKAIQRWPNFVRVGLELFRSGLDRPDRVGAHQERSCFGLGMVCSFQCWPRSARLWLELVRVGRDQSW